MNELIKINKAIADFANSSPTTGFEINYFETGAELLELRDEALEAAETPEAQERLIEILKKIDTLIIQ